MTTQTAVVDREDRFVRMAKRVVAALLLAVLVLSALRSAADARPVTTTMSQNEFVRACRDGGGTPKRIATYVVRCTTANGTVVTCNFTISPATCTLPFSRTSNGPTIPIDGGVLDPADSAPGGPATGAGEVIVVTTGTVNVQSEAEPDGQGGPVVVAVEATDEASIGRDEEQQR